MSKKKKKKNKPAEGIPVIKPFEKERPPGNSILFITAILLITLVCFIPVTRNNFLNFDDPNYITENPAVQHLDGANFKKYFTK